MRLLFVCTSSVVFGAEKISLLLLEGLRRRGHEVRAITSLQSWGNGEFQRRLDALQVPFDALPLGVVSKTLAWTPMRDTFVTLLNLPFSWRRYCRIRKEFQPDIVIVTSHRHVAALWPVLDARTTLLYVHSGTSKDASSVAITGILGRRLRGYVAVSDFIRRDLLAAGIPEPKVFTVRNGIDMPDRESTATVLDHTVRDVPHIGIVGQIGVWKGHDCLLQAAVSLAQQQIPFKIRIFGSGDSEYARGFKERILDAGLEARFVWMGYVASTSAIFNSIDICVVPSRHEDPYPTVALEAAAYGVPVVAAAKGGLPEIVVDGVTGYVVDEPAQTTLPAKLALLLNDPALRRQLGRNAAAHARAQFTAESMVHNFEHVCRHVSCQT